ncbi:hypothetical protein KSP39_PZI017581 [Platanthera zijinensis]|uniref:Uncharacterized protein n=1 Tax=Platanthera zijinensis TaxID=2320716 RepID=A0AAP0B4I1_9ASPA
MVSEKDFNRRAFRAEEEGKEKGEGGPAGPFSREQGSSFPHSQSCGGSFPAEVPTPADPGLTTREDEARTVEVPPSAANPILQAGGAASEPSATLKDVDRPLREDNSPHASGQAGIIVRKSFRPGLGKPLHLLYGTNGGVGPSRPTSLDGSRPTAGDPGLRSGVNEEGEEEDEEEEEEEDEESPLPSSGEIEETLNSAGSAKGRRRKISVILAKLIRRDRAHTAAAKAFRESVEQRLEALERDFFLGVTDCPGGPSAESSPGRCISQIRDHARRINLGCTTLSSYFNPLAPPRTRRRERGRWSWKPY